MNKRDRKHFEKRLIEERQRVLATLEGFDRDFVGRGEDDGDVTNYPLHLADEGTDTMEQEQVYQMAGAEGRQLERIDEALRTLYEDPDAYGRCRACGRPIARDRLDFVPWATLCIDDERASEQT